MKQFSKFIPFAKVDAAKQEVWGIATAEVEDKDGEICDYAKTKPFYQSWSEEFAKATDGKSLGNVRYMHQMDAVGKVIAVEFRDEEKEIYIGAKIVDDAAWKKVEEGVLTGFSQGGRYVEGPDKNGRYVAEPSEVSVVDNPCLGVCHFAYVKADGEVELRKTRSATPSNEPIAEKGLTEDDVRRIVAELSKAAEPKKVTGKELLRSAVDELIKKHNVAEKLKKSMWDVCRFAEVLMDVAYIRNSSFYERQYEADESTIPEKLMSDLESLIETFLAMAEEETAELAAFEANLGGLYMSNNAADLKKAAQSLRDHLTRLGKSLEDHVAKIKAHIEDLARGVTEIAGEQTPEEKAAAEAAQKAAGAQPAAAPDLAATIKAAVEAAVKPLEEKIAKLEKQPETTTVKGTLVPRPGEQAAAAAATNPDDCGL